MSPRRPVSEPPELEGYTYKRVLGSGGFADVFLYELAMPKMPVAVKVLVDEGMTSDDQHQLTEEANTMARFYAHPYIVGILNAAVSSDGRPYIVMEYYPRDNLWVQVRRAPLPVSDAIRTGVQIASAVETAHRAGVIHRDIKPANILVSEFGDPALSDFGIAVTGLSEADGIGEGSALSIPWSPPEAFDSEAVLDERSDVYSLGATVHTLLTGRSPFEVTGGKNGALDLMHRIERSPVPSTGRGDVPASLERALAQSMSKDPVRRHTSALTFARDLQAVEQELHLKITEMPSSERGTERLVKDGDNNEGETRGRITNIVAQPQDVALPSRDDGKTGKRAVKIESVPSAPLRGEGRRNHPPQAVIQRVDLEGTHHRDAILVEKGVQQAEAPPPIRRIRGKGIIVVAAVVAVLAIVVVYIVIGSSSHSHQAVNSGTTTTVPVPVGVVPVPTNVSVTRSGTTASVSWKNPNPQSGDYYTVLLSSGSQQLKAQQSTATSLVVNGVPAGPQLCVEVELVRQNGQASSASDPQCT